MCRCICKCILYILIAYIVFNIILLLISNTHPEYPVINDINTNKTNCSGFIQCGTCGSCSNSIDYTVYEDETTTLTGKAKTCAIWNPTTKCMENTGLTTKCAQCWAENMECTKKNCLAPCLLLFPFTTTDICFRCNEHHCADEFLVCAGLNRRRAGIKTDIDRAENITACQLNS